jgi:predicted alpha-1,6-mannanase (GH76 family)
VTDVLDKIGKLNDVEDTLRWWNSANALTALIDSMLITNTQNSSYVNAVYETFNKGPNAYTIDFSKFIDLVIAAASAAAAPLIWDPEKALQAGLAAGAAAAIPAYQNSMWHYTNFLTNFYDDDGWWALTWIKAFDLTRDQNFLDMAVTIAQEMTKAWDDTFAGGGIFWARDHNDPNGHGPYKNAIANELFMAVTARLYLRTQDAKWKDCAKKEYDWFISRSGLIYGSDPSHQPPNNKLQYLINDSLLISGPNAGFNDGSEKVRTYNQGVILGALCDLWIIFGDQLSAAPLAANPVALAEKIASSAITFASTTTDENGILTEPACGGGCDVNECQHKGIFLRNLGVLYAHDHNPKYSTFISNNATSILSHHNASNQFGEDWTKSPAPGDTLDFVRQTAAIDALNAANRVTVADMPISLKQTLKKAGHSPPTGVRDAISWLTPSVRTWALAWAT